MTSTITKGDLISTLKDKTAYNKSQINDILSLTLDLIINHLAHDNKVRLTGFGCFGARLHAARKGHNPRTGETIEIPAKTRIQFRPGKRIKEILTEKSTET